MSKEKTLSAEFWCKENYSTFEDEDNFIISFEMMNNYAEYYHQAKLNEITDKAIKKRNKSCEVMNCKNSEYCRGYVNALDELKKNEVSNGTINR